MFALDIENGELTVDKQFMIIHKNENFYLTRIIYRNVHEITQLKAFQSLTCVHL